MRTFSTSRSTVSASVLAVIYSLGSAASAQAAVNVPTFPVAVNLVYDPGYFSYFRATISGMPSGFSTPNGTYFAWCAEPTVSHATDDTYVLYNSTGTLPPEVASPNWGAVNWLLNNKPALSGLPEPEREVQTEVVQQVIWRLLAGSYLQNGGFPLYDGVHHAGPDLVDPLYNSAIANANFVPMPGQIIAIVLDPTNGVSNAQSAIIELRVPSPAPLQFVSIAPCRIMDTRNAPGNFGGPFIPGGGSRSVPIQSSSCGIPAAAQAYALNITVIPRTSTLGFLTVWPTGQSQPLVSTLNSPDGSVLANAAIVSAGAGGSINVFASNDTDLVIDINGYFTQSSAASLQFYPLPPCRVLDTRNPSGNFGGPFLAAGTSRSFPITASSCGVPASARAYSFNVTAVPHGSLGYLTAWPSGQARPLVSTLNSQDGTVLANAAIVPAGAGGSASFYASNDTDLVVDINGYFAPPGTGGFNFYAIAPCRIVDTRNPMGSLGGPIMSANTSRPFPLSAGACGLPATASAYSLNLTVVPQGPLGFLTTWPAGQAQPTVSTLNGQKGIVIANAALVPVGTGGSVNVYVTNATHVVIDANGYFAP